MELHQTKYARDQLFDWPPSSRLPDNNLRVKEGILRLTRADLFNIDHEHAYLGGFGEVKKARTCLSRDVDCEVMIKTFDPIRSSKAAESEIDFGEFQYELLNRLIGPGTPTPLGYGVFESRNATSYLIYQFIPGQDLVNWYNDTLSQRSIPICERLHVAKESAISISRLHSLGVAHRDLKGSNLILTPWSEVIVSDFDAAQILEGSVVDSTWRLKSRGMPGGFDLCTPQLAAPEVINGYYDGVKADIYSVGLIFFELINESDFILFKSRTCEMLTAEKSKFGKYEINRALSHIIPGVPKEFAEYVLCDMLNPDPQKRPGSLMEVIEILQGSYDCPILEV